MNDSRQSRLITAMRFPLIVLVVFSHAIGFSENQPVSFSLDGWNVYHFVANLLCRQFCSLGTCWFFIISGYFFFLNVADPSIRWIPGKWKKRVRTLLIPYLIWNTLYILVIFAKTSLFSRMGFAPEAEEVLLMQKGPLYWYVTGPVDYPLWFMRSLMIMTLLTPLLYPVFRRFPIASLVVLLAFYFGFPGEPPLLQMRGVFFFSIGALAGIHGKSMLAFSRRYRWVALVGTVILSVVATFRTGQPDIYLWRRAFYLFGVPAFMIFCDRLTERHPKREARLCGLAGTVFFIYAAHEIYILGWTKGICLRLFGDGLAGNWIKLIFVPVVVLLVCLGLYYLLNRIMPRTLAFCTGGRTGASKAKSAQS